jgi:hypothetical protein
MSIKVGRVNREKCFAHYSGGAAIGAANHISAGSIHAVRMRQTRRTFVTLRGDCRPYCGQVGIADQYRSGAPCRVSPSFLSFPAANEPTPYFKVFKRLKTG